MDNFIKKKFQRPDLWTSAQLGTGSWMSQGDMSKLRQMYQCDEGKSLCDKIQGPCVALPLLVTCIVFTSFSNFVLKII